jgi:hypothetical protein
MGQYVVCTSGCRVIYPLKSGFPLYVVRLTRLWYMVAFGDIHPQGESSSFHDLYRRLHFLTVVSY